VFLCYGIRVEKLLTKIKMPLGHSPRRNLVQKNTAPEISDAKSQASKVQGKLKALYRAAKTIPNNQEVKKLKIGKVVLYVNPYSVTIAKSGNKSLNFSFEEGVFFALNSLPEGTIPPVSTGSIRIYDSGAKQSGKAKAYSQKAKAFLALLDATGY
jgi:hypothetical protein